jgi:hypothetical protein
MSQHHSYSGGSVTVAETTGCSEAERPQEKREGPLGGWDRAAHELGRLMGNIRGMSASEKNGKGRRGRKGKQRGEGQYT